jgi:raffinose/stachyose/melibiose transport system substrate-binding protein
VGPSLVPQTYEQFIGICEAVQPFARKNALKLIPIAGSRDGGRKLLETLVGSQTQALLLMWDQYADMRLRINDMLENAMVGRTTLGHPAFLLGFELQREVGRFIQPGFLQLRREDANFAFASGNALMILVTSLDASSLRSLTEDQFEMVVFDLPLPEKGHEKYGEFSLGPISEAETAGSNPFAIVNFHPPERRALAVDFLQFLTSREANERFAMISGQLPVVMGARTAPRSEGFMPDISGYPIGPQPDFFDNDLRTIKERHQYLLFSPSGSAADFSRRTGDAMLRELPDILTRLQKRNLDGVAGQDALIASHYWLSTFVPGEAANSNRKLDILIDSSDGNEATAISTLGKIRAWREGTK